MASHCQDGMYVQFSQLRDSKKEENEGESYAAEANKKNEGRFGKIAKVHGGHIVRSTKKDKHTKVLTSKGPRDRRFRLSAKSAIDFYDVQDRLRCDRQSKAIDWLIAKAKAAIDALDDDQPHQEGHVEPEAVVMHQHCDNSDMHNVSNEADHGFAEEAVNYAPDFMDMAFFQSLIASNVSWKKLVFSV